VLWERIRCYARLGRE